MAERIVVHRDARWVRPITIRGDSFVFLKATSVKDGRSRRRYCQHVVDTLVGEGAVLEGDAVEESAGCASIMDADCGTELHELHLTDEGWRLLLHLTWQPEEDPEYA